MSVKNDSILIRGRVSRSRFRTLGGPLRDGSNDPATSTAKAWAAVSCHAKPEGNAPAAYHRGRPVQVEAISRETADAVSVRFRPLDGEPLGFVPGQHLSCYFEVNGQRLKRPYSFSAQPGAAVAQITVKRIADGAVSEYVNTVLGTGDVFEVLPPAGDFVLPEPAAGPLVFIAGGSGITPCICLLEAALRADAAESVTLIYANRRREDIIFAERLAALQKEYAGLRVVHVLDQPDSDWSGEKGPLDSAQLSHLIAGLPAQARYYICGPQGLMDMAGSTLRDQGIAADRVHVEVFTPAATVAAQVPSTAQEVYFSRSDQRIIVQPGETVLEAGLREGVPLEYSCTVGGCGHCKVRVSSGEVAMDTPNCLSDAEREAGERLICVGRPLGPLEIVA